MPNFWDNLSKYFFIEEKRSFENPSTSLSNPASWLNMVFGHRTKSGTDVNEVTSLSLSQVWAAVRIKADMAASLPINLFRIDSEGNRTPARNHPVQRLLSKRPYRHITSFQFRWTMQALQELCGNAYAEIIRNPLTQRPTELKIIKPSIVKTFLDTDGNISYQYSDEKGNSHIVDYFDMIHLRSFATDPNAANGLTPLKMGRENIGLALAAQEFEASFFGNGAHVGGYFTVPTTLDRQTKENISKSWQNRHTGAGKAGSTAILDGGMEYKRIGLTPAESMLSDSRKLSVEDVARWFNVPLYMLSSLDKSSFSNIEQIARDFINKSIRPMVRNWEEELELKLLRESEVLSYEISFDFSELLKGDSAQLSEYIRTLTHSGTISIDEARKMIGKNSINEDWSKKHWLQLNTAPTDEERKDYLKGKTGFAEQPDKRVFKKTYNKTILRNE